EKIEAKFVRMGVLPTPFCKSRLILPVTPEGTAPTFVLSNPFHWDAQEAIQSVIARNEAPALVLTPPATIRALLDPAAAAPDAGAAMVEIQKRLKEEYVPVVEAVTVREDNEASAPMIQLINNLIEAGYAQGASDIHLEPGEEEVVIRYRIDGDLKVVNRLRPARLIHPMVARIKIMANLDISERRLPQDGRIVFKQYSKSGADFDLRVATAPMNHGEKAVMRILDKQKSD